MRPSQLLIVVLVHLAECRGPHHPRSQPVAKHVHYRPTKTQPEQLMHDTELLHDTEHIQEHLDDTMNVPDFANMSAEEVEFYYFQVHDTDKNSKLDGLEILQAILDTVHRDEGDSNNNNEIQDFDYYIELIDHVLKEDDVDNDGYLSYVEYASGRKKAIIAERAIQPAVKMIK